MILSHNGRAQNEITLRLARAALLNEPAN